METVSCNLCGSEDYLFVYSKPDHLYFNGESFNVVECKKCGLGFVNPRPSSNEIGHYYPPAYYDYPGQQPRYETEAKYIEDTLTNHHNKLLLDIGCANGEFPRYMKELGWQVEGVEVATNSRAISDFKVYREEFPSIELNEPRYDAVTAWGVLEHVHDPMAYFKKASQVLNSTGVFVFMIPNFASISSRHLFLEDVPRHLYFFTEDTVAKYLSHAGLNLIKADYSDKVLSMSPVNWLHYYVYRYLMRRKFEWKDIPKNRTQCLAEKGWQPNLKSNLRYILANPLVAIDRALMPLFEQYQIISKKYGSVTYIAAKR